MNAVRPPAAPGTPAARGAQDSLIEARDIVLSFGQTPALRGASLSAVAGEILAIMGPSGSPRRAASSASPRCVWWARPHGRSP